MALCMVSVIVNWDFLAILTQKMHLVKAQKMLKNVDFVNHLEMNCCGMFYLSGLVS